ncbi:IclR family transcriptional regulator [Paenibacillus psychroresistens]|uniref:Glycerol operon regulatory protein n=1 Tax=Paenibacillus psychroresistens TaxID=1778678 RepID=A0A6B8RHA4_9BACL|nr:IclR family transcriptional regulator [Paenibacillus psychroresistens]QGQ95580.1 IclR family transcriptional regulator [Paenibacillus psychroresistens]
MKTEDKQDATKETPYFIIQSLDKTLNILQCFIDERSPMGVSEIARKMSLHKSVVHRLLMTLQTHGYLEQVKKTEKYMVGPKAFELGSVFTNSTDLVDSGKKILVELVEKTGFTAHLAILEKDSVLYLVNVEPDHLKYLFGAVGQRRDVYHSALGKCLTAWLPEEQVIKVMEKCTFQKFTENTIGSLEQFLEELKQVRQVGYATDKEERALGVHCVGAPVRNKQGDVIAAISISGYGVTDDKLNEISMIVKSSAAQLSRRNGNFDQ